MTIIEQALELVTDGSLIGFGSGRAVRHRSAANHLPRFRGVITDSHADRLVVLHERDRPVGPPVGV